MRDKGFCVVVNYLYPHDDYYITHKSFFSKSSQQIRIWCGTSIKYVFLK